MLDAITPPQWDPILHRKSASFMIDYEWLKLNLQGIGQFVNLEKFYT